MGGQVKKRFWFMLNIIFTVNYLIWRIFYTLPIPGHPISVVASLLLLFFECTGMVEQFVHFDGIYNMREYPKPDVPLELYPDVDIFISTYNEEEELLTKTINGCLSIEYPDLEKVHIYVIDDGNRPAIKEFTKKFGPRIHYLHRNNHDGKKAGNLNHSVRHTTSPYIITLDADMIVQSRFLMEIIPYVVDAELKNVNLPKGKKMPLGFIQTPQAFYDLDLFQYNLYLENDIPNEQDYFYRSIQASKTSSNTVIYGGSNTLLSRRAINAIGGFYTESITEDFATGCLMQQNGYVCMGTSDPLASGLSPNTLHSLIRQRIRWGRGVIDTGKKLKILYTPNLSLKQKLCYWESIFYWYAPLKRLIYILSPMLYATFGFEVMRCTLPQVLMFWLPMYLISTISLSALSGNMRSNKWTAIYETALFPFLLIPIMLESFGFSLSEFKVTVKSRVTHQRQDNLVYMMPMIILLTLSVIGICRSVWMILSTNSIGLAVILFWMIYNMYVMLMSLFFLAGRGVYRSSERVTVTLPAKLVVRGKTYDCTTVNMSENGACIQMDEPHLVNTEDNYLIVNDRKWHVRVKLHPIRVSPRRTMVNGKVVTRWEYAFSITDIPEERGYENLCGILYDRVPTHASSIMSNNLYKELNRNFLQRQDTAAFMARSLPRIIMNTEVKTEEMREPLVLRDFNYQYMAFTTKGVMPRHMTLDLDGFAIQVVRDKKLSYATLYRIEDMDHLYTSQEIADAVMNWMITHSKGEVRRGGFDRVFGQEFNETAAVMA